MPTPREQENELLAAIANGGHIRVIHDGLIKVLQESGPTIVSGLVTLGKLEDEGLIVRDQEKRKQGNQHVYQVISPNANARLREASEKDREEREAWAQIRKNERSQREEELREEGRQEVRSQIKRALGE